MTTRGEVSSKAFHGDYGQIRRKESPADQLGTSLPSLPNAQNAEARGRACSTHSSFNVYSTPRYQHHLSPTIFLTRRTALISPIMVADAVIYHPAVSHYLRYVATTGT